MVWQILEAELLTELLQQWEPVLEPLLLFAAYVAVDVSKNGYFSLRNIIKREIASAVFYFTLVFFMHFILTQTLATLITQTIVMGTVWFAGLVSLILLTAVVFKNAIKNEIEFKALSDRTSNLETRFEGLLNRLNQESQKASILRTQLVSTTQSTNTNITLLMAHVGTSENNFKRIVEDYKALVGQYQADAALSNKRLVQYESLLEELQNCLQSLLARVEELTRLQREYKEKIEETLPTNGGNSTKPAATEIEPVRLTKEDGVTNRKKGNNAQVETYEFLKELGFLLENDCSKSSPDFLFYNSSLMVGVGAHKAFTLTKQGTRQRSISAETLIVEYETAKELRLPLILFVLNLDNRQRWAHFIPHEELDKFKSKSVCTPLILAENSPEAYETLRNSILEVKKQLGY
jgi:hypothetical protein